MVRNWVRLLERTRYGAVWQVRQAAALVLLLLLLSRGPLSARFGEHVVCVALLTLALGINAALVFTGHGAATEPLWLAGAGHAVHLLAAGAWARGLPALAYLLLRRTLSDPGKTILGEAPSHMEFLLDRFGYVRARWLQQDEEGAGEGWRDTPFLLDQIERIHREPRILPPPVDHVH